MVRQNLAASGHEREDFMNTTVLLIIIANVAVSFKGFKDRLFFEKYKFQIGPIVRGEKIRILSSGFLHVDPVFFCRSCDAIYRNSSVFGDLLWFPACR